MGNIGRPAKEVLLAATVRDVAVPCSGLTLAFSPLIANMKSKQRTEVSSHRLTRYVPSESLMGRAVSQIPPRLAKYKGQIRKGWDL